MHPQTNDPLDHAPAGSPERVPLGPEEQLEPSDPRGHDESTDEVDGEDSRETEPDGWGVASSQPTKR